MKRVNSFFVILILLVFVTNPIVASAFTKENVYSEGRFYYHSRNGYNSICGYIGSTEVIDIPSSLCGKPVSQIEDYAFKECNKTTKVILPDTILFIGEHPFDGMDSLETVESYSVDININVPEKVKVILKNDTGQNDENSNIDDTEQSDNKLNNDNDNKDDDKSNDDKSNNDKTNIDEETKNDDGPSSDDDLPSGDKSNTDDKAHDDENTHQADTNNYGNTPQGIIGNGQMNMDIDDIPDGIDTGKYIITVNENDDLIELDKTTGNTVIIDDKSNYKITSDKNKNTIIVDEDNNEVLIDNEGNVYIASDEQYKDKQKELGKTDLRFVDRMITLALILSGIVIILILTYLLRFKVLGK